MVQGKTFSVSYKDKRRYIKSPSEWTQFDNAHQPIISETAFQVVSDLLSKDNYSNSRNESYLFTGFAICGNCRRALFHRENKTKNGSNIYWQCMNKDCRDKRNINEKKLVAAVQETLKAHIKLVLDYSKPVVPTKLFKSAENDEQIKELDKQIKKIKATQKKLLKQMQDEVMSSAEYDEMTAYYQSRLIIIEAEKEEVLKRKTKLLNCIDDISARFKIYSELPELTREVIATFINKVVVENKKSITISFRYADFFVENEKVTTNGNFLKGGEENGS